MNAADFVNAGEEEEVEEIGLHSFLLGDLILDQENESRGGIRNRAMGIGRLGSPGSL